MNPNSTEHRVERLLHKSAQAAFLLAMLFALLVSMVACSTLPEPGSPPTPNSPLQTPTLNVKEALLQKIKQTVESARIKPPTPEPLVPIPGSTPAGAGAIVKVQSPFSNSMYHIENTWYTDLDSKRRLFVYAGSVSAPGGGYTDQGIVIIQVPSSTGEILPTSQHLTPEKLGSVRVVGAVGDRLILQSTSGTTFYFDVPSRQFVPSLTWVSPLSTPGPKLDTPEPTVSSPPLDSTPAGAGAIVSMIPLLYTNDFRFENTWYKDTEGGNVRIYVHAGSAPGPGGDITQQGLVVVQVLKMSLRDSRRNLDMVYYKQFPTPTQSGSIHITGAVGDRLILQSTSSTTFYFDVPSRQFVPSLTWVSPISTPGAQPTKPAP